MNRKLTIGLVALLSAGVLAIGAAAQAELHWYKKHVELTKGAAHTAVATKGPLTIASSRGPRPARRSNARPRTPRKLEPVAVGQRRRSDQHAADRKVRGYAADLQHEKFLYVKALGLPWQSHLWVKSPKEGDEVEGVELQVGCLNGGSVVLEGALLGPVLPGVAELEEVLENTAKTVEAEVEFPDKLKAPPGKIEVGP